MKEPIDEIQEPKTRRVLRLSFYFRDGSAQDFNICTEDGDTLVRGAEAYVLGSGGGLIETTIYLSALAWKRESLLDVKRKP